MEALEHCCFFRKSVFCSAVVSYYSQIVSEIMLQSYLKRSQSGRLNNKNKCCTKTKISEKSFCFANIHHEMWNVDTVRGRGVRSLKFVTPTPLLLWLNILRLRSDAF